MWIKTVYNKLLLLPIGLVKTKDFFVVSSFRTHFRSFLSSVYFIHSHICTYTQKIWIFHTRDVSRFIIDMILSKIFHSLNWSQSYHGIFNINTFQSVPWGNLTSHTSKESGMTTDGQSDDSALEWEEVRPPDPRCRTSVCSGTDLSILSGRLSVIIVSPYATGIGATLRFQCRDVKGLY